MDHSRSPRRYHNAGGQVSYYPPLSDEARRALRGTAPEPMPTTRFLQIIETIRRDHTFCHDEYGASIPLEPLYTHILATMNLMTQAEAFAAPGAIGALWVGPPTPDGVPTEQERNARMWLPRFAPPQQTPPPFAGQGHRLGE